MYFLFQYLVAPKGDGTFCWWFLKTSVVPLVIYPDSPPLVEGDHLVQALWFVVVPLVIFPDSPPLLSSRGSCTSLVILLICFFRSCTVLVKVQLLGYKFGLTYTWENTVCTFYKENTEKHFLSWSTEWCFFLPLIFLIVSFSPPPFLKFMHPPQMLLILFKKHMQFKH